MKKTKKLCYLGIIVGLTIVGISSVTAFSNIIQAYIVDYDISYGNRLTYPLISYNDNTYMAVRDVASLWNKDVSWQNEEKRIEFLSRTPQYNIIKEPETALSIGKAIFSEYYKDKMNENSVFHVCYSEVQDILNDDLWWVSVIFNPKEEISDETYVMLNADARIEINPLTCNFALIEAQPEGGFKTIIDFKSWK